MRTMISKDLQRYNFYHDWIQKLLSGEQKQYPKSIMGIIQFIYKTQGFYSFWRGNIANCLRLVLKFALDMVLQPEIRSWYRNLIQAGDNYTANFFSKRLSLSTADTISTVLCYPLDFARTRLATDVERSSKVIVWTHGEIIFYLQFNGIIDCWHKTIQQNGVLAIYSGMMIGLFGDIAYKELKSLFFDFLEVSRYFGINSRKMIPEPIL